MIQLSKALAATLTLSLMVLLVFRSQVWADGLAGLAGGERSSSNVVLSMSVIPVPEPGTLLLLGVGLVVVALIAWRWGRHTH